MAALGLAALVAATAMAVDIAREVDVKRRVEEVADLAAKDAHRAFEILNSTVPSDRASLLGSFGVSPGNGAFYTLAVSMARDSLVRNSFLTASATTRCATDGQGTPISLLSDATNNAWVYVYVYDSAGNPTAVPCGDPAGLIGNSTNSTQASITVVPHTYLAYAFAPGGATLSASGAERERWAQVGTNPPGTAEFSLGSFLGRGRLDAPGVTADTVAASQDLANLVGADNALLSAGLGILRGSALDFDVASYRALMSSYVTLTGLATAAGDTGRPDELLSQSITVPRLLTYAAAAASARGDSASLAAANVINQIISRNPSLSTTFTLGQLFSASPAVTGGSALWTASIDVADLITAAMEVALANGQTALSANLPLSVSGLSGASVTLGVIEPPQAASGPPGQRTDGSWLTEAHTAQIRAQFDLLVPVTGLAGRPNANLGVFLSGANATAHLSTLSCSSDPAAQTYTIGASSQGTTASVGTVASPSMLTAGSQSAVLNNDELLDLSLTGGVSVSFSAAVTSATTPGNSATLAFPVTAGEFAPAYPDTQTIGTAPLGGQLSPSVSATVTGGPVPGLSAMTAAVTSAVNGALGPAGPPTATIDAVTAPVLEALGLSLAGADITGYSPTCSAP